MSAQLSDRLNSIDRRLDGFEQRMEARFNAFESKVEGRFSGLDSKVIGLDSKITGLDSKIDRIQWRMTALIVGTWISVIVTILFHR